MDEYSVKFSHEYPEGPSGPARSYWKFDGPDFHRENLICLHARGDHANPELTATSILHMLEQAFKAGQRSKAEEIRKALGVRP